MNLNPFRRRTRTVLSHDTGPAADTVNRLAVEIRDLERKLRAAEYTIASLEAQATIRSFSTADGSAQAEIARLNAHLRTQANQLAAAEGRPARVHQGSWS